MANINAPFGFRQSAGLGSAPTYEQITAFITAGAGAIYYGDPVTPLADGSVAQAITSGATPNLTTNLVSGIFQGCKYLSTSQKRTVWSNYYPGGGDPVAGSIEAYVVNDPNAQFVVQTDSTGAALTDINATFGFNIGTGNAANGLSGAYLVIANSNVANMQFRVTGVVNFPPSAPGTLANGQPYDWVTVAFSAVQSRNFTGV